MRSRRLGAGAVAGLVALAGLTGCGTGKKAPSAASSSGYATAAADHGISANLTVLTNRTDLVADGTMNKYSAAFNEIYPNIKITWQTAKDYEGDVKTRMSTNDYGDVLLIPNNVPQSDYPNYFAPLGSAADLAKTYRFVDRGTVGDKVYGITGFSFSNGFVYNKKVWAAAGITTWPTAPAEFLADLQAIKDKTKAIPYYTNYKDQWPLSSWSSVIGSPSCDTHANDELAATPTLLTPTSDLGVGYSLLYGIVDKKLSEPDPTTTNWENSKGLIANGQIATMWLGSWAIVQMQAAAAKAGQDPSEIGYMPFPAQANGKFCAVIAGDYQYAINAHSKNVPAARAFLDWEINDSTIAADNQAVAAKTDAPLPAALKPFTDNGVQLITLTEDKVNLVNKIDNDSQVGLSNPENWQKLVDIARGAQSGDLDSFFKDLNGRWATAEKADAGS
jgi:ABC-type glycerol-3-phosphate transport system substrate-binding protein